MDIKLIISDIDGTLIDSTEEIPDALIRTIRHCKEKGIRFALATGRTKELVDIIVKKLEITEPYVVANGACIFQGDECILSHSFCAYPILDIIKQADEEGLTVTFSDENLEKASRLTDYVRSHQKLGNRFQTYIDIDNTDWKEEKFQKIMFMDEHRTGKIRKYQEKLKEFSDYYWVTSYSDMAVELGPKDCNKATGLQELAKILNLNMSQIMACGDFDNDVEMIREAGIGVAVGNANSGLKETADYAANAEYCFGVIEAIEKYCF